MTLPPSTRLGRYEVRSLLGVGGMGEVYLAYDHDLEREVAIKVLREDARERPDREKRFVQEAKAASGLRHPNVAHVYEIGSQDGMRFIAMELVSGLSLRDRMARGTMPIAEILDIATQIAAALAAAHKEGIVHRDVKPENVMVSAENHAKVLDFGLAKLHEPRGQDTSTMLQTAPGAAVGTISYMAPEQIVGGDVHAAADVFSLGVVLYEMLCGTRPHIGATSPEVVSEILSKPARPVRSLRSDTPPALETIVHKALAKKASDRYGDAGEMLAALQQVRAVSTTRPAPRLGRLAVIAVVIAVLAIGGWKLLQNKRRSDAMQKIVDAERLLQDHQYPAAYEMASAAASVLPDNDRARDVISRATTRITIESNPPGANVYLQRWQGPNQRDAMGVTPLTLPRLPRGDYLLTLEKEGYAPGVRTISTVPFYNRGDALYTDTPPVRMKLAKAKETPPGMVLVEGEVYRLTAYDRSSDRAVELRDFFIDRYEVSNREFEQFVRDGGYRRRELWKVPFVDNGRTLSFDEAMTRFHDTTGLAGPRSWSGGVAPAGRENHPVTDVTWYEAAAFAEWKGKKLPSIYQWEKASKPPADFAVNSYPWGPLMEGVDATERSNFLGRGTLPVDSMPFGAGPYGSLHMAGNVSEWCRNAYPPGYAARGGSYKDNIYAFGQTAALPGFFSSPTLGFRCVSGGGGDEGDFALSVAGFSPVYKPVDDATYATYLPRYAYKAEPLNARIVESIETPDWTRQKIIFTTAGKSVPMYLYLPKGFRKPLQAIQFAPAGDVTGGLRTLPHSIEVQLAPLIRAGRAIFSVELEGFLGRPRPAGSKRGDTTRDEYVDYVARGVTEMRRAIDYVETRPDIDRSRIAFLAISAGGGPGVFVCALERRYRAAVFAGSGVGSHEEQYNTAARRINFAPHIAAPTLMIQGKYDEDTNWKSEAEPLYRLLRAEKRLELYEGSHIAPAEVMIPAITKWLDEKMGPVQQ